MPINKPGFVKSASYLATGWQLVRKPGLRRFVLIPLLVNLLVFGVLGWLMISSTMQWLDSLALFTLGSDWWIVRAVQTLLHWLISAVMLFSLAYVFTLVANVVGAPFNGLLSERVEAHLLGEVSLPAPALMTLIRSVPRLLASEVSKLVYLVVIIVPLLLLQFVPLVNLVAPFLLFLFGAWMFALEYMDYPLGNHGALFKDVRRKLRQHRGAAFGFGSVVALLSTVPIVNLLVMPVAVAGATALYVDYFRDVETGN